MPRNPDASIVQSYDRTVSGRRAAAGRGGRPAPESDAVLEGADRLDLGALTPRSLAADPRGADFDYAEAFATLDLDELARDVDEVLVTSQNWWPADYGHYGPLMLRMAWHCAGTYRVADGRGGPSGGMQRFAPMNSWPDNRNLDKARRLLWPVKRKYGTRLSWSDLMVFAGTRALESMGLRTLGFAGGRDDAWAADLTYWGPESGWFQDERHSGVRDLDEPLAASEMGLIYVDPQGPATVPDPVASARDIRQTFGRMGMDDEETVALIAGGHSFGKTHGRADPTQCLGAEPEEAPLEQQGLGWRCTHGSGSGADTVASGLEGVWTPSPITWDNGYLETLFGYEWEVQLSPGGLWQWVPADGAGAETVPDAHDPSVTHAPVMLTTDLALREDPAYEEIARRFWKSPDDLADAFARAWFKLTHLDMGPIERYRGPWVPTERFVWQDPLPQEQHRLVGPEDIAELKARLVSGEIPLGRLVATAWMSAATFRDSDKRGGADGGRLRLEPQCSWEAHEPERLRETLDFLERVRAEFHAARADDTRISMADLIVLAGCAAVEKAAERAGQPREVPFRPGRVDATQEWTDPQWFACLEPVADGFRGYLAEQHGRCPEHLLLDRAALLTLTPAQLTVLLGGLRVIGAQHGDSRVGVLTDRPGALTNDFFVHLLDMDLAWSPVPGSAEGDEVYQGRRRGEDEVRWTAGRVDMVFAAHAELRAIAETYAAQDAGPAFVDAFVAAWDTVMNLGRYGPPAGGSM